MRDIVMKLIKKHGRQKIGLIFILIFQLLIIPGTGNLKAESQRRALTFRKGDALRLTIWQPWGITDNKNQHVDLNGDYIIDSRGYVSIPLIGEVKVIGHNAKTLAEVIGEKSSQYMQDPIVIAEPLIRVTMLGAFIKPGTYLIPPDASLWELVDLAGGPTDDSNLNKMQIERGGETVKKKLLSSFERAYSIQEIGIKSGDQIIVPTRNRFGVRDALDILYFGITMLNLYILIERTN